MIVQSNRLEDLRQLAVGWMRRYPLNPLENEVILVQSNGIAQWLKLALAADPDAADGGGCGIAAAIDVQLPARFQWQAYRSVLERGTIPATSLLDRAPLTWRLMRLLPALLAQPVFAPLHRFLHGDDDLRKRHQLSERLADLFDQYQVYRADWLTDWAAGRDVLRTVAGTTRPLDAEQSWQPALWRAVLADVGPEGLAQSRAGVHQRFLEQLSALDQAPQRLPRRVMVFGISSMPAQTLEALAAMARFVQVLLCVHNPSQHHWGDIVADKELLRHEYRRQQRRPGTPDQLDADAMHAHGQPLLAAWGKQGRDYISLLDRYDEPALYSALFQDVVSGRIDLFDAAPPDTLLAQLQNDVLNLRPLAETRQTWPPVDPRSDRSIRFEVSHSPQREVEILHDQLLARFNADPSLRPRDVIVMVPDIDAYAPHIRAVFGQVARDDLRFVPFTIADQGQRGREPLLIAVELLLKLPDSRFAVSEVLDLLDVPAVRARFGISDVHLPVIHRWIEGAGVRWGVDGEHRQQFGMPAALDQNSWYFGLRRMLLGYAVGNGDALGEIEPYDEVGGLDAALAGLLAELLARLDMAREELSQPATPVVWTARLRALLSIFLLVEDDRDALHIDRLITLLEDWAALCRDAGLETELPLSVVREAWLAGLDQGGLTQRFLSGSVNFCTLMPMRAIPFRVVCLLGMNDGDYPRIQRPMDFDLMGNDYRPGDRSRREDDRYLLLEAMLSARDHLYVSWVGRSIQDNSERAPSVLIGQLRDHLAAGWRLDRGEGDAALPETMSLVDALTCEHPLQPFSRRYFGSTEPQDQAQSEGQPNLQPKAWPHYFTYAREWRDALSSDQGRDDEAPLPPLVVTEPLNLATLSDFLVNPVAAFLRQRLNVRFDRALPTSEDNEVFELDGLQTWQLQDELSDRLRDWAETDGDETTLAPRLAQEMQRLQRQGRLPMAAFGQFAARRLETPLPALLSRYRDALQEWTTPVPGQIAIHHVSRTDPELVIEDWAEGLRRHVDGRLARVQLISSKLHQGPSLRWHVLLRHWVRHLALQTIGEPVASVLVSMTDTVVLKPVAAPIAASELDTLLGAWRDGMQRALPVACKTAFAWLEDGDYAASVAYDGAYNRPGEAAQSAALARVYADYAALTADGTFSEWAQTLYGPLLNTLGRKSADHSADADAGGEQSQ
ncbi:exodeoxyribonuclease V subunit gamma [Pigmentiphaga aceris]|uniref:RecBCD enzyme subunit RecC n=2 Tax=Pigmentiphaga aceris TaxID=1940612 RepID=A0A5C0B4J8_9BURK|nr:exodeoxyribonuclease V subunit gamma [Pigmentiphaga aceris]